jgi:hypothetical protein
VADREGQGALQEPLWQEDDDKEDERTDEKKEADLDAAVAESNQLTRLRLRPTNIYDAKA